MHSRDRLSIWIDSENKPYIRWDKGLVSSRGGMLAHFLKNLTYLKKFDMDEPKILFIWTLTYGHIYVNWAKSFNLIKFRVYITFLNALEMG